MSSEAETRSRSESAAKRPRFVLIAFASDRTLPLQLPAEGVVVFGRGDGCELRVDHPSVSRKHARFRIGRTVTVEDLGSRNGTIVRGTTVAAKQPTTVRPGDVIECGDVSLIICAPSPDALPASEGSRGLVASFAATPSGLVIGQGGRWFQPMGGMRINIGRRGSLQRVLLSLAEHRLSNPGVGVKVHALIDAGWPGERMLHEAGLARAYTTIQRLRALGLQQILLTHDDGYLLSPTLPVQIENKANP